MARNSQSAPLPAPNGFPAFWNVENVKVVRRVIISVVGATVLLIGVALLVLPGPAFIVIPISLAILASEYARGRGDG